MPHLAEILMKIVWLVPEIQAVDGFAKNRQQRKFFLLIGYISKSIFASSDSFCLITSDVSIAGI